MKKQRMISKLATFAAGMAAMGMLMVMVGPALASENGGPIAFDQVGVRIFGEQKTTAGERYTAPNGQEVPMSITYTDAAGGKTNYLSIRQIAELFDTKIDWNAEANSVDIAAPDYSGGVTVTVDPEPSILPDKPEYGLVVGVFEEIDPAELSDLMSDKQVHPVMSLKDTRVQYQYFGFPNITHYVPKEHGQHIVFTVTNNGDKEIVTTVAHEIAISLGMRESFPSVAVKPGETLVRAFRAAEDADILQRTLVFDINSFSMDHDTLTDVTVSLEQYP